MALLRDIVYKARPTVSELINLEKEKLNLKAVSKVTISFDPFAENVKEIRLFSYFFNTSSFLAKNPKCVIKTEILSDRSEQTIRFDAVDGQKFVFKCKRLSCLEVFQLFNKYITPLAPPEEDQTTLDLSKFKKKK